MNVRSGQSIVFSLILVLFLSTSISCARGEGENEKTHPILQTLKPEIEKIFKDVEPEAMVESVGKRLAAKYRTRKYFVHLIYKTGEASEDASEVIGPDYQGIIFNLSVFPGRQYLGERAIGQTFREPYWMTYFNAHPIKGRDEHLFVSLSYGIRADDEIVEALKTAVAKFEKEK